jgi:hypothetical protein
MLHLLNKFSFTIFLIEERLLTTTIKLRVLSQINQCGIYDGQTGSGIVFFSEHLCFAPSLFNINRQFSILTYLSYHGRYVTVATNGVVKQYI